MEIFPGSSLLVEGQVPRGVYLLLGPSGVGKTVFCKSFLASGLVNNERGVYLSTDEECEKIQSSVLEHVEDRNVTREDLRLIDAYSWRFGGMQSGGPIVRVNPSNLTEVSIACDSVCRDLSKPRFVLDSITSLVVRSDAETALRFLEVVTAKMRRVESIAFCTIIPASHDNKFLSTVRALFDGIVEMRLDETGWEIARMLRIFSLKGAKHRTHWVLYTIDNRGITPIADLTPRCAYCGGVIVYEPPKVSIDGREYVFHAAPCEAKYRKKLELYEGQI